MHPTQRRRAAPVAFLVVFALASGAAAQSPLTTIYASNNGGNVGGSVYFDLQVNTGLAIVQIDLNTTGSAGTLDVYSTPTSHVGNETNAAAWTLLGTAR